jgi:hypothetical protein
MSVHFYDEQSAQLAQKQGVEKIVPGVADAPMPAGSTPSTVTAQVDAALTPTSAMPKLAAGTDELEKRPSLAPPGAGAALTVPPSPATDAEVKIRQDPPIPRECPQAVATLGLCNPDTKQKE